MDPNIISLRIGSLRLSGVGARPGRRKCRESRSRRGGLEYVQERKGGDSISTSRLIINIIRIMTIAISIIIIVSIMISTMSIISTISII